MNVVLNIVANIVAKTSIILFSAAILSLTLRRASASARHAVWLVALISTVLLPLALTVVPQLEWPVIPDGTVTVRFFTSAIHTQDAAASESYPAQPAPAVARWVQPPVIWAIGFGLLLIRLLSGTLAARRIAKRAAPNNDREWSEVVEDLSASLSLRRPAAILFSDTEISPMTFGVFRHKILLPASAADWAPERRLLVLAHELAHVKRRDSLAQIAIQIICGIYWFNPLVWYAAHRMRIERERACDDQVLNLGAAAADYADHLIQIVRSLRDSGSLSFAAVSMAHRSQLETRLVSILDSNMRRRRVSTRAAACMCAVAGILTISLAAVGVTGSVQPPPVYTFSGLVSEVPCPLPSGEGGSVATGEGSTGKPFTRPALTWPSATFSQRERAAACKSLPSSLLSLGGYNGLGTPVAAKPQRTRIGNAGALPNNTIIPPQVIESKPPIYTDEALLAGSEGTVTLEIAVDAEGKIKILRIVKGLGFGLSERAMGAVLDWKFSPALRNGVPVPAVTQVDVDFKLPPPKQINGQTILRVGVGSMAAPVLHPPIVLSRVDPEYSDEARAAHYQGTVVLEIIVRKDGTVDVQRVVRPLGLGLDEKAVEAIKQWRFKPGTRNDQPVDVSLNVEVNFNLR